MNVRSHVDRMAWTWLSEATREQFRNDGVSYLQCELLDGTPIAWAPLGSGKPSPLGEGVHWRIREVRCAT